MPKWNSNVKYKQGIFTPTNPKKYLGNVKNIVFRSSWEIRVMRFLDTCLYVIWWNSEELRIPYLHPLDQRIHNYHPDFVVHVQTKQGPKTFLLEIKPDAQTSLRQAPKVQTRKYLAEVATYAVNMAKWEAAKTFCEQNNWTFKIVTEKDIPAFTGRR
jgi:hypothetical protein